MHASYEGADASFFFCNLGSREDPLQALHVVPALLCILSRQSLRRKEADGGSEDLFFGEQRGRRLIPERARAPPPRPLIDDICLYHIPHNMGLAVVLRRQAVCRTKSQQPTRLRAIGLIEAQQNAHRVKAHHIISHYITLHHVKSYHVKSHQVKSHHVKPHHVTSHYITSHQATSHHITSHHISAQAAAFRL